MTNRASNTPPALGGGAALPDLSNWARHYSINPVAYDALQSLLRAARLSPPAPGGDALQKLIDYADMADDTGYGTVSSATVRDLAQQALAATPAPAVEREAVNSREHGLFRKYRVERTDGSDQPGGKHDGCDYFVLDMTHDPHARPAIVAYARSLMAAGTHPLLVQDLVDRYVGLDIFDTPPAEAREPVGVTDAMVREARVLIDRMDDSTYIADKTLRAVMALTQPRDTPRDSGDALDAARDVVHAYRSRFGTPRGLIGPIDEEIERLAAAMQSSAGEPT